MIKRQCYSFSLDSLSILMPMKRAHIRAQSRTHTHIHLPPNKTSKIVWHLSIILNVICIDHCMSDVLLPSLSLSLFHSVVHKLGNGKCFDKEKKNVRTTREWVIRCNKNRKPPKTNWCKRRNRQWSKQCLRNENKEKSSREMSFETTRF